LLGLNPENEEMKNLREIIIETEKDENQNSGEGPWLKLKEFLKMINPNSNAKQFKKKFQIFKNNSQQILQEFEQNYKN
jgi:hypothetical protein